jgi:hypothetical protein
MGRLTPNPISQNPPIGAIDVREAYDERSARIEKNLERRPRHSQVREEAVAVQEDVHRSPWRSPWQTVTSNGTVKSSFKPPIDVSMPSPIR